MMLRTQMINEKPRDGFFNDEIYVNIMLYIFRKNIPKKCAAFHAINQIAKIFLQAQFFPWMIKIFKILMRHF